MYKNKSIYDDINILFIGPTLSGKTSLINNLISSEFTEEYTPTMDEESYSHKLIINNNIYNINICDTPGADDLNWDTMESLILVNNIIIITYDLISNNSKKVCKSMVTALLNKYINNNKILIIIGTKKDLSVTDKNLFDLDYFSEELKNKNIYHFINSSKNKEDFVKIVKDVIEVNFPRKKITKKINLKESDISSTNEKGDLDNKTYCCY